MFFTFLCLAVIAVSGIASPIVISKGLEELTRVALVSKTSNAEEFAQSLKRAPREVHSFQE
jgi:hypothetical protein